MPTARWIATHSGYLRRASICPAQLEQIKGLSCQKMNPSKSSVVNPFSARHRVQIEVDRGSVLARIDPEGAVRLHDRVVVVHVEGSRSTDAAILELFGPEVQDGAYFRRLAKLWTRGFGCCE